MSRRIKDYTEYKPAVVKEEKPKIAKLTEDILKGDFKLPKLSDLINLRFVIYSVRFDTGKYGEYAVVTTDKGDYITSSEVLLKQLKKIEKMLEEYDGVEVRLIKRGRYYTFAEP